MFEALAKKYFRLMAVLGQSGSIDTEGHCSIGKVAAGGFHLRSCHFTHTIKFSDAVKDPVVKLLLLRLSDKGLQIEIVVRF